MKQAWLNSPLRSYLQDIGHTSRLTADEEIELGHAIRSGDMLARERMYLANLPLVIRIARAFQGRGLEIDDLVEEGNVGLGRAVDLFDPEQEIRFSTFAYYQIRAHLMVAIRKQTPLVHVPMWAIQVVRHAALQADPAACVATLTPGQQACHDAAQRGLWARDRALWIDDGPLPWPLEDRSGGEGPEAAALANDRTRILREAMRHLNAREREIVAAWYGLDGQLPESFVAIGRRLGTSKEYARQLAAGAKVKLAAWFDRHHIQFEDIA